MATNQQIAQARRERLRAWIDAKHEGRQADFQRAVNINQGELSQLLRDKPFGEKKAANLEKAAGMPKGYLVNPLDAPNVGNFDSQVVDLSLAFFALCDWIRETRPAEAPILKRSLEMLLRSCGPSHPGHLLREMIGALEGREAPQLQIASTELVQRSRRPSPDS